MKRLIFLLMLVPGLAFAQAGPEVYRVATPAQILPFDASISVSITEAVLNRIVRTTCTAACYIWINSSGQSFPASTSTGVYLPANDPEEFIVSPGSKVRVIGATSSGDLHVIELTK